MSKIEWTELTWNPIVGCSKVSAGCKNCYAERMACRLQAMYECDPFGKYKHLEGYFDAVGFDLAAGVYNQWSGKTAFIELALDKPLKRKKATTYFVCSMCDLFHETVPFEWIDKVMFTIYKSYNHGHTFQILTKRPERMAEYFLGDVDARILELFRESDKRCNSESRLSSSVNMLPRVWLGVTVEHPDYKHRIDELRKIPAAIKFLSLEPLLADLGELNLDGIDWVICGGESGPGARPMHPDWARSLRDQCKVADVPFFFKQWGEWLPLGQGGSAAGSWMDNSHRSKDGEPIYEVTDGYDKVIGTGISYYFDGIQTTTYRIGKKKAGSLLDGVEHKEYPK